MITVTLSHDQHHHRLRLLGRVPRKPVRASSLILGLTVLLILAAALASHLFHSFAATSPLLPL